MQNKATKGMYDTDGAGRELLTGATEDAVHYRLEQRGFSVAELGQSAYDRMFDEELMSMQTEAEDSYAEFMEDCNQSFREREEYFMNLPGGEADYQYG